ncbi:MAG: iron-containing alcohol dehydrogenase [Candidatus Dormibacteria bacterium]
MVSLHQASPARRVLQGCGALGELRSEVDRAEMSKVVLVTSATLAAASEIVRSVERQLEGRHQATFAGIRQHTPENAVNQLADLLEQTAADGVVSLGGGSVIDGCKAAIHIRGAEGITHLAVPTTLSGAEFTASAGVTDEATQRKRGVVDQRAAPQRVVLDPEVTLPTPERLWLSSGIRALDHAVETVWAPERDPLTILLALEAIRQLRDSLPACQRRPADVAPRETAQIAAWWAALGLAGNSMGPSHHLGRILGAAFAIPHGITSCVFLPATIDHLAGSDPALVGPLEEPFGVHHPGAVAGACREFITGLGLPVTLAGAGLAPRDLPRFLAMVPEDWRAIVGACA